MIALVLFSALLAVGRSGARAEQRNDVCEECISYFQSIYHACGDIWQAVYDLCSANAELGFQIRLEEAELQLYECEEEVDNNYENLIQGCLDLNEAYWDDCIEHYYDQLPGQLAACTTAYNNSVTEAGNIYNYESGYCLDEFYLGTNQCQLDFNNNVETECSEYCE